MSATDPQGATETAVIYFDLLTAAGEVPLVTDLFQPTALAILQRQWGEFVRSNLGGGGGASAYFSNFAINPGATVDIASYFTIPLDASTPGFAVGALDGVQPAFIGGGAPPNSLRLPGVPVAAFNIPAAALAPAGWIDSVTLVNTGGTAHAVRVATNGVNPSADTVIPFAITAGAIVLTGVVVVAPVLV